MVEKLEKENKELRKLLMAKDDKQIYKRKVKVYWPNLLTRHNEIFTF